jgi:hypothetical protein
MSWDTAKQFIHIKSREVTNAAVQLGRRRADFSVGGHTLVHILALKFDAVYNLGLRTSTATFKHTLLDDSLPISICVHIHSGHTYVQ